VGRGEGVGEDCGVRNGGKGGNEGSGGDGEGRMRWWKWEG